MSALWSSFFSLLLALLTCQIAVAAVLENPIADTWQLAPRQADISCQEYATIANLSTIAANSTFRAAFIKASPEGTVQSENILTNAQNQAANMHLINDTALNQQCGNLTDIAMKEAPKNFSKGTVGPFQINEGIRLGSGGAITAMMTAAMVGAVMLTL